jgi:hypothetical protein
VAWLHALTTETYREASITSFSETDPWVDALKDVGHAVLSSPLTPHAPAQSALDEYERIVAEQRETLSDYLAMQCERDELRREVDALRADRDRLDYLDAINIRKNAQNGTTYGWRLSENHNRIALEDHDWRKLPVRTAIDTARASTDEGVGK